jgi:mannan endo-1,4-beta-mannosidase
MTTPTPEPTVPPPRPARHASGRAPRSAGAPRLAALSQRLGGIFHSRPAAIVITAVAAVSVAAVTIGVLEVLAPNKPVQQPPSAVSSPQIGAFSRHPVRIRLPALPHSYLGVYADGVPRRYAPIESFAATAAQPNIALYYSGWGEPFQAAFATQAADHHAVPLVQVEPGRTSLAAIAAGGYDTYLETFATAVANYGAQTGQGVIISFGHEPNGPWYPWGRGHVSPATWVAAWRHMVNVFRQQGADNVTWLWTVNIIAPRSGVSSPAPWWPGSSYVTWVGIDGYYYKPSWTFASLFGPTIKAVRALTLAPILISETGAGPAAGQPAKIANLFAGTRAYGLLGFVWFDAKRKQDWRLSSPASAVAYRAGAKTYQRPGS